MDGGEITKQTKPLLCINKTESLLKFKAFERVRDRSPEAEEKMFLGMNPNYISMAWEKGADKCKQWKQW